MMPNEAADTLFLTCTECDSLFEVLYEIAVEIWEWEERTGEKVTCSDCPDAYQKAQLEGDCR